MTLILSLGNRDYLVQVSERRLTALGKIVSEEANKAGIFSCENARVAYGFTGIAQAPGFRTSEWIATALHDCAPKEYTLGHTLDQFRERATQDFQSLVPLRRLRQQDKRLSIMFTGYLWASSPPTLSLNILTNFQDLDGGVDSRAAWDEFRLFSFTEPQPLSDQAAILHRIGAWPATTVKDGAELHRLLCERRPHHAVIQKAVEIIRLASTRPQASRTVGKQITAITIWPDRTKKAEFGYYSEGLATDYPIPDLVVETDDDLRTVTLGGYFQMLDQNGPAPFIVPKTRPNAPCPCGSGKKYKYCHGQKKPEQSMRLVITPERASSRAENSLEPPGQKTFTFDFAELKRSV
jgi:hypothetical protein